MDVTPNRLLCEISWTPVDSKSFVVCVSCKAPFDAESRRAVSECPTFGCPGISVQPGPEFLAGTGRDVPKDSEVRVKSLTARRQLDHDTYKGANCSLMAMVGLFFALATVVGALTVVCNTGANLAFWAFLLGTVAIAVAMAWINTSGRRLLNRIALIDLELDSLGYFWDGTAKAAK